MFLLKSDFYRVISQTDFNLLINNNDSVWQNELNTSIETVSSYLRARYDVVNIFKSFSVWSVTAQYAIGDWLASATDVKYICIAAPPVGTVLTNTTYFTQTDPRNCKIVEVVVDIVLYNLFARLNNYDIPALRKERYDGNDPKQQGGAIGYLKNVSKGLIMPNLPLVESRQTDQTGNIIMYGNASDSETNNYTF